MRSLSTVLCLALGFSYFATAGEIYSSITYKRMTVRSFAAHDFHCRDATNRALFNCEAWLSDLRDNFDLTANSACRAFTCGCSITEMGNHAICLGQAEYLTTISASSVDGHTIGMKKGCPLKQDPILSGVGIGLDCYEAEVAAKHDLFPKLERLSNDVDIIDLRPVTCSCRSGYPTYNTCKVRAHALWERAVPWDAPPCD